MSVVSQERFRDLEPQSSRGAERTEVSHALQDIITSSGETVCVWHVSHMMDVVDWMWNAVANLGVADLLSLSELEISPGHASLELDHCGQCGALPQPVPARLLIGHQALFGASDWLRLMSRSAPALMCRWRLWGRQGMTRDHPGQLLLNGPEGPKYKTKTSSELRAQSGLSGFGALAEALLVSLGSWNCEPLCQRNNRTEKTVSWFLKSLWYSQYQELIAHKRFL